MCANFPIDAWNECRSQTPATKGKDEGSKGLVSRGEGEIANLRAELMCERALEEQLKVMEENVRGLSKKWEELEVERKIKVLVLLTIHSPTHPPTHPGTDWY